MYSSLLLATSLSLSDDCNFRDNVPRPASQVTPPPFYLQLSSLGLKLSGCQLFRSRTVQKWPCLLLSVTSHRHLLYTNVISLWLLFGYSRFFSFYDIKNGSRSSIAVPLVTVESIWNYVEFVYGSINFFIKMLRRLTTLMFSSMWRVCTKGWALNKTKHIYRFGYLYEDYNWIVEKSRVL